MHHNKCKTNYHIHLIFSERKLLDEAKCSYTDLINIYVRYDKQKLKVFDRNGVYLPTKKIGKNNPKAEQNTASISRRLQSGNSRPETGLSQTVLGKGYSRNNRK